MHKIILTILIFSLSSFSWARYISCKQINCDCENINAGILNIGWKPECRKKEKKLKEGCAQQGHWTASVGYCGPDPYGDNAFPVEKNAQKVVQEVNQAIKSVPPKPMKLIYTLLPFYGLNNNATNEQKIFAELQEEFTHPAQAIINLNELFNLLVVEGGKDTLLSDALIPQLQMLYDQIYSQYLLTKELFENSANPMVEIYKLLPEKYKDSSLEENVQLLHQLQVFFKTNTSWAQNIFDLLDPCINLIKNAYSDDHSRLDLEGAKKLLEKSQTLIVNHPFNSESGKTTANLVKELLPEMSSVIEYGWLGFH